MRNITKEEFLENEVERCHASIHSQIETLKLLAQKHFELKYQKREWVELTLSECKTIESNAPNAYLAIQMTQASLREKNT